MMMQTRRVLILIALIGALAVGGCAAPAAAPAAPAAGGPPQVTLTTNPNPASSAGETEFVVEVKDSAGKPLSGVKVLVTADMAAHSMGALQGPATDQGNGRYATRVPLNMAGQWEVIVEVRQDDAVLATQEFIIPVP
jgi:hypothetical protein